MKRLFLSLVVVGLFILFGVAGCEKDTDDNTPPNDSIPNTDTCHRTYYYLNQTEYSFVDFLNSDTIKYYKNSTSQFLFDRTPVANNYAKDCSSAFQYVASAYLTVGSISQIYYLINPYDTIHFPQNFIIRIGDSGQFGCQSYFKISTGTETTDLDSIQLLDKTFYDVYSRTSEFGGCASGIYYNKQYGVIGFNWLGEWYVLETDSL